MKITKYFLISLVIVSIQVSFADTADRLEEKEPVVKTFEYVSPVDIGKFVVTQGPGGLFSHFSCITYNNPKGCHWNQYAYDIAPESGSGGVAVAVKKGTVSAVWRDPLGGNCVIIDHQDGYFSEYCHLDKVFSLSLGQEIGQSQQIGSIGSTGEFSSGAHLHFSFVNRGSVPKGTENNPPDGAQAPPLMKGILDQIPKTGGTGGFQAAQNQPVGIIDLSVLGKGVNDIYNKSLGIGGLLALAIIVYGGLLHILSGANIVQRKEAQEWIKAAIYGLILLALAYFILNNINPCLVGRVNCPFIK